MLSLQHPYIAVERKVRRTYGGAQQYASSPMIRRCGCGIVAAADLVLYLRQGNPYDPVPLFDGLPSEPGIPLPFSAYDDFLLRLNRKYLPMIPYAGINGPMLMTGVQRIFHDARMPYSCRWRFLQTGLWDRVSGMLQADIPVIMSVGPNFPNLFGGRRVPFYIRTPAGTYLPASGARSHFFSITEMDGSWLRVSSWGRSYYMNRWEYQDYVRSGSLGPACNILYVCRR